MPLLSVAEYARMKRVTPQAVYQKIRRGTLKSVVEKVEVIRIPVDDTNDEPV